MFPFAWLFGCVPGPLWAKKNGVLWHGIRSFRRAPPELAPPPRGTTGEFLAQILDLATPPPRLYDCLIRRGSEAMGWTNGQGGNVGGACDAGRGRCRDLAMWCEQAATACAPVALCSRVSSLVRVTLELNYYTNWFHQTVHALSARLCKMRHYTNVIRCSLKIPPSKPSPGV